MRVVIAKPTQKELPVTGELSLLSYMLRVVLALAIMGGAAFVDIAGRI